MVQVGPLPPAPPPPLVSAEVLEEELGPAPPTEPVEADDESDIEPEADDESDIELEVDIEFAVDVDVDVDVVVAVDIEFDVVVVFGEDVAADEVDFAPPAPGGSSTPSSIPRIELQATRLTASAPTFQNFKDTSESRLLPSAEIRLVNWLSS
jgi:hypothetical protein